MSSTNPSSSTPNPGGQTPNTSKPAASAPAPSMSPGPVPARKKGIGARLFDGNRLHKVLIILLALGCITLYVWHLVDMSQVRSRLETEMTELRTGQSQALSQQAVTSLRLTGQALGWAVAPALIQGDLAGIDAHITRMVKVGPVAYVAVVDHEGVVRVATNKKLEGQSAATALAGLPITAEDVTVAERGGELVVVAPVMQDDARIGAAVLAYTQAVGQAAGQPAEPAPGAAPNDTPAR